MDDSKKTFLVFSDDLDKVLASFILANGAAAMGNDVTMFFAFWGVNLLRKTSPNGKGSGPGLMGRAIARGLAGTGARVHAWDIRSEDGTVAPRTEDPITEYEINNRIAGILTRVKAGKGSPLDIELHVHLQK